jgi:hypothetical protein
MKYLLTICLTLLFLNSSISFAETLGATSIGESLYNNSGDGSYGFASQFTAASSGTSTKIGAWVKSISGSAREIKMCVYAGDVVNDSPQDQIVAEVAITVPIGYDSSVSGPLEVDYVATITAGVMSIALTMTHSYVDFYYDAGPVGGDDERTRETLATNYDLPATWGSEAQLAADDICSFYVTYTPEGGGSSGGVVSEILIFGN